MKLFDVIIIGGGLSGSSTAVHLSKKGYSVLVLEKSSHKRIIPCAGGMAATMRNFLPIDIKKAIETEVKRVHFTYESKDNVIAELTGESPFLIVKREVLDNLLIEKAKSQGTVFINSVKVKSLEKNTDSWTIKCNNKNSYESKFLVIADGSESQWSTFLKLGPKRPRYAQTAAIRLNGLGNLSKNSVRFDFGSIKYGFSWAFPLKQSTNIGMGTFIGNCKIDYKELSKNIINYFGFNIDDYEIIYKRLRIWNGFYNLHIDRALVIGDAASLCDPFLAEGIRPALLSSFYAAESINQCLLNNDQDLSDYSKIMRLRWSKSMAWGKRIAEVFYRFPQTGYRLGVKRKTAPKRIAQILSGEMSYSDIAQRVIKRLLFQ